MSPQLNGEIERIRARDAAHDARQKWRCIMARQEAIVDAARALEQAGHHDAAAMMHDREDDLEDEETRSFQEFCAARRADRSAAGMVPP